MKFVVTSRAKTKIRHYIRQEQRERSGHLGRDLLNRELRKRSAALASAERDGLLEAAAERLRVGNAEDLLVAVGYGRVSPEHAADAVLFDRLQAAEGEGAAPTSPSLEAPATVPRRPPTKRSIAGIRVQGEAD